MLSKLYRILLILVVQLHKASSLQCYGCYSTVSWESCDKNSEILQCDPGLKYCVKLDYSLKSTGLEGYNFLKVCSSDCDKRDFSHCLKGQSYENSGYEVKTECNLDCCTDDLCNAGSTPWSNTSITITCVGLISTFFHLLL